MNNTSIERNSKICLCLAGATGRMGTEIARLAGDGFIISGSIAASDDDKIGKTLKEAGIASWDVEILPPNKLQEAVASCDVYVTFTSASAELQNIPKVVELGKPLVIGTTGFSLEEKNRMESLVKRVPTVMSSNFSIGATLLFSLARRVAMLPKNFDISIVEMHHSGKLDSPSGTAKKLAEVVSEKRGYTKLVSGRQGASRRLADELEVLSIRAGGIPGHHMVLAASQNESIKVEHDVFSRSAFAAGALQAARWVLGHPAGLYGMEEVLGIN